MYVALVSGSSLHNWHSNACPWIGRESWFPTTRFIYKYDRQCQSQGYQQALFCTYDNHGTADAVVGNQQSQRFHAHAAKTEQLESVLNLQKGEDHFSVINPTSTSWILFVKPFLQRALLGGRKHLLTISGWNYCDNRRKWRLLGWYFYYYILEWQRRLNDPSWAIARWSPVKNMEQPSRVNFGAAMALPKYFLL